jgi:hypothetical protein
MVKANRKARRAQGALNRRTVRATAKATGLPEPTPEEKDPGYLALQVSALRKAVEDQMRVQRQNTSEIQKAFSMVDMHQQVLQRVIRELAFGLKDGSTSHISLHEDGRLNLEAYYQQWRDVAQKAGPEYAMLAVVVWSHGYTPEQAIEHAKVEVERQKQQTHQSSDAPVETDYEVEQFGGTSGQDHHQSVSASAEAVG